MKSPLDKSLKQTTNNNNFHYENTRRNKVNTTSDKKVKWLIQWLNANTKDYEFLKSIERSSDGESVFRFIWTVDKKYGISFDTRDEAEDLIKNTFPSYFKVEAVDYLF